MNNSSLTSVKIANTSPGITSLSALQTSFGLFRSGGDFYVIDLQQVTNVKAGKGGRVEFYKKQPGELLLKRFLEDQ